MPRGECHTSIAFYKPFNCLSQWTREVETHVTLADYLHGLPEDIYAVGRLDRDSEGLLLVTNDRKANQRLLSPASHVEKEYWVQVEGTPSNQDLLTLSRGVPIRVKKVIHQTLPCEAEHLAAPFIPDRTPPIRERKNIPTSWLRIVLREGKNRQVRKMCAAVGFPVLRLLRYRVDTHTIDGLLPGQWRTIHL